MKVAGVADAQLGGPGGGAAPLAEQLGRLADEGAHRLVLLGDLFQAWVGFHQYETPGIREFLEQGTVRNSVNFPGVEMARESPYRVAIANANVPNMLGQISTTMAHAGLNIHTMVNKSRGEMAYTLVDVDSPVDDAVIAALAAIEGVLSVRAIPVEAAG